MKKLKTGFRRNNGIGGTIDNIKRDLIKTNGGFRNLNPDYAIKNKMIVSEEYQRKFWKNRFSEKEINKYNVSIKGN